MKWLKWIVGVSAIAAAGAAVGVKAYRDKQKQAELDAFLCPDVDDAMEVEVGVKSDMKAMEFDILGFENANEEDLPVVLAYGFESEDLAKTFQTLMSDAGLSSTFDAENLAVDVVYRGDVTESELHILSDTLVKACDATHAVYQGFHFSR